MDLVEPGQAPELEKLIRLRNLHARIYPCAFADIPLEQVLDIRAFDMDHILASDPDFLDVSYPFEWSGHYRCAAGDYRLSFENAHGHAMQMLILYANDGSESAIRSTTEGARAIFRQGFLRTDFNPQNDLSPLLMYDIPEGLKRVQATIHLPQNGDYLLFLEKHPHHFEIRSGDVSLPALHTERYGQGHAHESVQSVAITFEGTLDGGKVEDWLTHVLETKGDDLYRTKGILSVSHSDRKIIIQAVHRQLNSRLGADWGTQPRQNVLVFIGRNLDRRQLESGLLACMEKD
jgi:G3E family GTPase